MLESPPKKLPPLTLPATLSIVIPVYNEENTIESVLASVLKQPMVCEVVIVDDASSDKTWEVIEKVAVQEPRLKIFRQETNQGKGAALQRAFSHVTSEITIIQDADLEYDPSEYSSLIKPITENKADVVFGSRFSGADSHRVLFFWHYVGNVLLTLLSNIATNLNLTDMEVGYKVFRKEVLKKITIEEKRFGIEPEITAKVSRLKVRIYEVPISYHGRTYEEGKKINWKDGVSALRCIIKYNFLK